MDLNKYLFPLKKWWWLIVASVLVSAIFGSLAVLRQPTIYQAHATLMIGTTIDNPNPSNNEFLLGQQLAAAYADIANREIVRNVTMNALGMDQLPGYIARAIPNSQLIEIVVNDTDPERAQIVANELAAQLVLLSPTSVHPEDQGRQEFINQQLNNLEIQIQDTEDEIEKLQEELGDMVSAVEINDTQNQISALESKLNTMRENYGTLLSNTQEGAFNTLTVIEPATMTSRPIGQKKGLTVLLAMVLGFVLAACEAYLLEYLDDTLKSPNDVMRLFLAPIIGHVFEQADGVNENQLYNGDDSSHPLTEPFRALRTAIDFAETDQPLKTILVSSPDIGDGKTSVAVNLALSIAQKDKKVLLLDADLRKPKIHKVFNLANDQGFADLVFTRGGPHWNTGVRRVRNLSVLTAGLTPPDPAQLLSSEKMNLFLSELQEAADVIIIDGPPFFVPDAMILASKVDGVLLVVRPGHTRQSLAKATMEHIKLAGAKVVGIVLNRIPLRGADYYAGKSYLYTYQLNYGEDREGMGRKTDLERLRDILLPYANKVTDFIKHLRSRFQT